MSIKALALIQNTSGHRGNTLSRCLNQPTPCHTSMLLSSDVKLYCFGWDRVFFMVACIALCFGFVTKTALIILECSCYCWAVLRQHQCPFWFSRLPASKSAGGAQEVAMGHSWDSWPKEYSIPYDIMPSNTTRSEVYWGCHFSGTGWALVGC